MNEKRVELLAPAGSYDCMVAAVNAGADAVYAGGSSFGARAYAGNFDDEMVLKAIDYMHIHGKSLYLTVNTLLKENEIQHDLYEYLKTPYEHGLDAVIVQDMGVFEFVRQNFPDIHIHCSTQMSVTGYRAAKMLEKAGATRIVTAREISLSEIKKIRDNTNVEIESFVHGALCYCYSGQCLYSSLIGGRSGNRGRCAQPCRLPYRAYDDKKQISSNDRPYVLSPKDMCTLEIIPDIIESGVYSFKIEGRMKKPEYVAAVVSIYRKYIDLYLKNGREGYRVEKEDLKLLMDMYNRGGFSEGYYNTKNGKNMMSTEKPNHYGVPVANVTDISKGKFSVSVKEDINKGDILEFMQRVNTEKFQWEAKQDIKAGKKAEFQINVPKTVSRKDEIYRTRNNRLINEMTEKYVGKEAKEQIKGEIIINKNEPLMMSVTYKDKQIKMYGEVPSAALKQPLTMEALVKQMNKTGNTPFSFVELKAQIDEDLFVPIQSLNDIRRKVLMELEDSLLAPYRRNTNCEVLIGEEISSKRVDNSREINCYTEDESHFDAIISCEGIDGIYIDSASYELAKLDEYTKRAHDAGKKLYIAMPHIFREQAEAYIEANIEMIKSAGIDGIMIKNNEEIDYLKSKDLFDNVIIDHNMYTFNKYSLEFYNKVGISKNTAPLELNYKELLKHDCKNSEIIVYGFLPMMVSAQCVQKTLSGCFNKQGYLRIKDRFDKEFVVKNNCRFCYNVIYNSQPLSLLSNSDQVLKLFPASVRLNFTTETGREVAQICEKYVNAYKKGLAVKEDIADFTRGHFKRGIE